MYLIVGRRPSDPLAPLSRIARSQKEARFASGDYFWQLNGFAHRASGFWADTLIVTARKKPTNDGLSAQVRGHDERLALGC
jgi:hypothetical protein